MKSTYCLQKILLLLLSAQFFLASCKKYLDEKSDSSLTVPTTLNEIEGLFHDADLINFGRTPSLGEASCDDYFLLPATFNALATQFQEVYNWTLREYRYQNDWGAIYLPVYNSNFALESLEKIPRTTSNEHQWNLVKGMALFTRAHSFFSLSSIYAKAFDSSFAHTDKGIVLRLSSDFNLPSQRASVLESYTQILSDAKEASIYLPDLQTNVLIPSKAASYGLLARVYLSMRVYDSAFKYSNLCLSLKSDIIDYNSLPLNGGVPFPRFNNPETIYYTEMSRYNANHFPNRGLVDTILVTSYHDDDLRKKGFFTALPNGYHRFKGAYTANSATLFSGIATDEIMLVRAECFARKGFVAEAMNDLNTLLRKRWSNTVTYVDITAADQVEAISIILNERRKELLMRGLRWIDIKRLNKEGRNIIPQRIINGQTYTLPANDNRYALPIPIDIVNITGIAQNEF